MARITISIAKQRLYLEINSQSNEYIISTSKFGPGEKKDSFALQEVGILFEQR